MNTALWAAKTGLDAQQTRMAVTSNNLANVSTTGFKKGRAVFEDLMYQNVRQVGGSTSQDTEAPSGLSLGTGVLRTRPKGTLVQTEDRVDQLAFVGAGVKGWLTSLFIMRGEYRKYVVFTDRDDNEEVNEWKLGFAFFF